MHAFEWTVIAGFLLVPIALHYSFVVLAKRVGALNAVIVFAIACALALMVIPHGQLKCEPVSVVKMDLRCKDKVGK